MFKPQLSVPFRIAAPRGALLLVLLSVLSLCGVACPQTVVMQQGPVLDDETRSATVREIAELFIEHHVFPEVGQQCADHITGRHEAGAYDDITDHFTFANLLTEDLRSVRMDLHVMVMVNAGMPIVVGSCSPGCGAEVEMDPETEKRQYAQLRRGNYGFKGVQILPGNVGYVDLTMFSGLMDEAKETATAALHLVSNTDAVIIDLRNNGGGAEDMVAFLASYFIPERTHLNTIHWRKLEEPTESWTLESVPGKPLYDTPLYIVTSNFTGSAAEAFAYCMKHLGRATIVGETTGGAAHPVTIQNVQGFFSVQVPTAQVRNAVTGVDWEGTGVIPHVESPATDALQTAHIQALRGIEATVEDTELAAQIRWVADDLEAQMHPADLPPEALEEYVGSYGDRSIALVEGQLMYSRVGRPTQPLLPVSQDLFRLAEVDFFRLRFERNEAGEIIAAVGLYDDGLRDRSERDPCGTHSQGSHK